MCCGMFDAYEPDPNADPLDAETRWVTIHVYSRQDAIADGVLVPHTFSYKGKTWECCLTDFLWKKYHKYPSAIRWMTETGVNWLQTPDPEDTESLKRRVILKDQIWVVLDRDGLTFLKPEEF